MPIVFNCYSCGNPFHLPDEWAGKQGRCPHCTAVNLVPAASPRADPEPRRRPPAHRPPPLPPPPFTPRKRSSGSGVLPLLLGCGGLFFVLVVGLIAYGVWSLGSPSSSSYSAPEMKKKIPPGWTEVNWIEGRCRFVVPGSPLDSTTPSIHGEVHTKGWQTLDSGYMVHYWDNVPGIAPDSQTQLEQAKQTKVNDLPGGYLVREAPISLNGHPGREYVCGYTHTDGRPALVKVRSYVVRDRMYHLMSYGPGSWADSVDTVSFLDSFTLTN